MVQWQQIQRTVKGCCSLAFRCICCHWTMYQKTNFQPIRMCLPHAHVTYLANVTNFCTRRHAHWVYCNEPRHGKTKKMNVRPAKTQISLGIRPVWSVFAVRMKKAWVFRPIERTAKTDQTGRMPRLIWVFAGRTVALLVLSCRGSNIVLLIYLFTYLFMTFY